jgi:hypothetical protein
VWLEENFQLKLHLKKVEGGLESHGWKGQFSNALTFFFCVTFVRNVLILFHISSVVPCFDIVLRDRCA